MMTARVVLVIGLPILACGGSKGDEGLATRRRDVPPYTGSDEPRTEGRLDMTRKKNVNHWTGLTALLALVAGLLAGPGTAGAQVTRQPTTHVATPPSPQALEAMVNPLQGRVESLERDVQRLQAALESLRATVKANQQEYAKHKHSVPGFGILSAKAIYPATPVSVDTQLLFTCPSCSKTSLSGPPQ